MEGERKYILKEWGEWRRQLNQNYASKMLSKRTDTLLITRPVQRFNHTYDVSRLHTFRGLRESGHKVEEMIARYGIPRIRELEVREDENRRDDLEGEFTIPRPNVGRRLDRI